MVGGVTGLNGTIVRLREGVHNIAEQGFATIQHQLTVVMTALLTVQVTLKQKTAEPLRAQLMVGGVTGLNGTIVRLRVGVHNIAEQGFATIHHQLTVVTTALLTVQVTLKQKTAEPLHAQLMVDGVTGLSGTNVQLLVGAHNIAEQGFATTQHQLTVVMTALLMVQVTLKQKTVEPLHAQLMVYGVTGLSGTNVQLRVGVHNIAEQGFVTIQHQRTVVMTALLMVQVTLKQKTAELIHARLMAHGARLLSGDLVH